MKITQLVYLLVLGSFLTSMPNLLNAQCSAGETLNTYCYDNGEVNNIAFEVCPTAGMAIESSIVQGSFFAAFNDNLTVYSGTTGSGLTGTVVFGPMTGNIAGNTVTSLGADQCLIFVTNSNTIGIGLSCADGSELELQVCSKSIATSTVNFTAPADLCINSGVQTNLSGGIPTGGVYSGPGVTDGGDGSTYSFDPSAAGVGVHTLTYTNGSAASDDIEVFATGLVSFTAPADLCIDAGTLTGQGGGSPSGGTYSGPGVTDDGNGMTYSFNPAAAGLGVHTITYTEAGGCNESATDDIEVLAACGCPAPQTTYFHCSDDFESNLVIFEVCPSAGEFSQATINQGTYSSAGNNLTVYQGTTGSGIGGTIVYGPQTGNLAGAVITSTAADECLIFVSNTIAGSCQNGQETALQVCGESLNNPVFFTAPGDLCINDGVQSGLGGGIPTGGVYSGSGVTDGGDGMTFSFDPTAAGVGVHTLTYTLGGDAASDDVEVVAIPTVTYTAPMDLCIDEGNQTNLGGGTPVGGVYSGPGVTDNGDGISYSFNPLTAGLGVHTITYTESGACMETATDNIEVTAACSCPTGEVTFFNCYDNNETNLVIFEVCPNAGEFAKADITQGSYGSPDDFLTIYQGATGSGTSGAIVFGPLNGNFAGTALISTVADECLIFVSNTGTFGSCADGFELPLIVCGSSLTSNVTFTALDDLSVNAGIQPGLSGGSPTGGVYSGPGVTDDGNGMTYTFDPAVAGVGVHTLTYTTGSGSATDNVEVLNLLPPSFSKSFNSNQIGLGSVSTLTFTINNTASGTGVTDLAFVDNLPAGVTIATPPAISSTCSNATVSATAGGSTITVTDGSVGANTSCTISVNVTSSTAGTHTNTTGDLTSSAGNSGTASANLTVATNRPGFSKSFSPSSINLGERSTLTFTFDNSANTVAHSNLTFTDNLPVGMVVANPSNATIGCTGGVITAVPGSSVISYTGAIFTDASVAAGATCTISVDVIGGAVGQQENVTGDLTSLNNFFQLQNSGKASAILDVSTPTGILLQKSFTTNPVSPGGTTNLEFTITNLDRDFDATNVSFTDDLTAVLAGLTATGTPLNDICGTGSQLSGTTMLTFTGGTIPANGSCTISVPIQIPAGAASGTYTNVTSNITADINGSTVTGNPATENLYIASIPTFTKTFLTDPIVAGGTTTLEFTITNTSTTSNLTDLTFSDPIADFLSGATASNTPAAGSCGAGSLFFVTTSGGNPIFQMVDGNIAPGASCTFSIDIMIPSGVSSGTYTNTTSLLSGTVDGGPVNVDPATDDLTVLSIPTLSKSFTDDPVNPGDIVNLEFTINYDEFASGDATDITFTDDLNAVIPGLAAVGLPINDICGTSSSISGTTNLTFSGGTLSPGGTCTFSVPVQVPAGIVTGSYTNTTSAISATVGGQAATGNTATDDLEIGGFTFTKEFIDGPVIPGELTTLRFTFDNTSTFDATNIIFTDNLNGVISGLSTEGTLPTGAAACNATNVSGTTFFIYVGGSVGAGTSCSFDIPVRVPASAASGTYTNTTSNMTVTIDGATRVFDPITANLVVNDNLIGLTKTFTDDPVSPGGTATVEYTLTNLDPDNAITNIAFTDDFDAALTGLAATGLPMSVCGGTVNGTGLLSFTGGSLAAGASCTFSVILQTPASTPFGTVVNCPTSEVTGEIGGLAVVGDAANDDLQFQSLQFTKAFAGSVAPGGTTTLTFTITNFDPVNSISQISFTDDLDAVISGMVATTLPTDLSLCGALAGITGTSELSFGRGELGPGENCSFDVTVMIPCGTAANTYTNTTSTITGDGAGGMSIVAPAATADLLVTAAATAAFTALADLCIDAGAQTGLGGGTPTGGVYSGPGVTDGGDGMTYSFNPATANVGTHTLTYTYTDGNGCVTTASDMVEVFALPIVMFTAPADLCIDAGNQTGLGGGTPTEGTATGDMGVYSGTGVTDDGNGMTYSFNPMTAGIGVHTLTYTYTDENGCTASASDMVEVFALPTVMFTAPADLCIDAGNQTGLGGGTPPQGTVTGDNGVYSGPGVSDDGNGMTYSFNPMTAGAGTHTLTYTYTDENGCSASASDMVEVFALPTVMFTAPVDLCIDAGNQTGLGGGTPPQGTATGDLGVYSGTGVTDDGNGMTYSFNPMTAGVGVHTLTYTYTNENGCTNSASDMIEVFALPIVMFTAPADLCVDAGVLTGLGGGTPPQGTATGDMGVYSGPGVTDAGDGMTYSFNPMTAGAGTHTLTYTYTNENGCSASASDMIEVFALPATPTLSLTPATQCLDAGIQLYTFTGSPNGGVYSGPGVNNIGDGINFTFNPAVAGVGSHTITYTVTNANGCATSATDNIEVLALPVVIFTAPADLCLNAGTQTGLGGGTPPQGTATGDLGVYSGPGVTDGGNGTTYSFNPMTAGVGTHTLTYSYTDENGCSASASDMVEVFALPTVMFTAPADLCIDAGVQAGLGGGTPPQGTATGDLGVYSGPGVTDGGNGMTYSFNPMTAGAGTHTLTYTYTDENGCSASASDMIEVFALPIVVFTAPVDLCIDAGVQTGLGGGTPPQGTATGDMGVYSGPGVTDGGNGMTYSFNPMTAGVGVHTLTYTYTNENGCTNSASDMIEVFALPTVMFTAPADLCVDAGVQAGLGGGTPPQGTVTGDMGVYSGPGVTDDGNGMTYSFDPAMAGVGTHTLTYTYIDENGCSASASDMIEVFALPIVMFTAPTLDVCIEDPIVTGLGGGMPTGGVYNGTGVMDDANGMTFSFDPTASATMGGDITVTYTFTDANGCSASASDDIFVNPICCELIVSCPPASLGTITCNDAIPTAATDEASFEALGGDISDDPEHCGILVISHVDTYNPPTDICGGQTLTRVYTIADDLTSENCTQTLMISAPTGPSIICPADMTVECLTGISVDPADAVVATDCSQGFNTVITGPVQNGDTDCPGTTYTYTYTVTDDCGRMASCEQVFTIENMGPTIICPADMTVECLADISVDPADAVVTTDCSQGFNTVITGPVQNGDADCPGTTYTYTYTYTVTDDCGRMASCEQVFTIENMGPTIICPADMTVECLSVISVDPVDATVTTSCTLGSNTVITGPVQNGDSDCPGTTYTYTYTVTDDCGRMASCEQVFTIENMGPTITCPADMTVECIADASPDPADATVTTSCTLGFNTVVTGPVQNGDADCPGTTYTYTYTVTDDCGRMASCEQVFTIDNVGPSITCPADMIVECLADIAPNPDDATVVTSCTLGFTTVVTGPVQAGQNDCPGTTYTYTYTTTDACGRMASCEQVFTIQNLAPIITCPADEIVTCFEDIVADPNNLTVVVSCGLTYFAYVEQPLISGIPGCDGTVYTYTYNVTDECGRERECQQVFTIQNNAPTVTVPADESVACFDDIEVSIDDMTVVADCPGALTLNVLPPVINGPDNCPGTTYTYTYRVKDFCNRIVEVERVFTILDTGGPVIIAPDDFVSECEVSVNADNAEVTTSCGDGITYDVVVTGPQISGTQGCPGTTLLYTYTVTDACGRTASDVQTITIDNDGPVIDCPQTLNILNCEDGDYNALIEAWIASVSATAHCGGIVSVTNDFNGVNGLCITNGFTNVTFIATDQCGITNTCIGTIVITDTEAPIIFEQPQELLVPCNGVTQDIFDNWLATQGGAQAIDGCWGGDITWSMIPANPTLNCAGGPEAIIVEFVATDGCGNSSFVTGIFNTKIQPDFVNISGVVYREDLEVVEDVEIAIEGGVSGIPDIDYTSNIGYGFPELEYEDNLVVVPKKNDDPLNGVTTFDLILLHKHILGLEVLDSPYKQIAGDINRSGHLSAFDLILLRKLILYIDTEFTSNTSWRFVDSDFVFPNPDNPFETAFPELFELSGLETEVANFIGVKIGDLNLNAITSNFVGDIDDRSGLDDLVFEVDDQTLHSGEQYRIDFTAQNFEQINGFQFTLNFDQTMVEAVGLEGADLSHFNENNYGLSKMDNGAITISWNHNSFQDLKADEVVFSLILTAKNEVELSNVLSITSEYTRAEAYQSGELMNVNLAFNDNGTIIQTEAFRLFQNQPNPFKEATMIGFNLPKAEMVSLKIYDVSGRLVYTQEGEFAKGYNQIDLNQADLPPGVLYYHVNTVTDSDSKKMILLD